MAIAFPLAAPFWSANIPDPVATLWGNALGAAAAVAGAAWVADRQARSQQRSAAGLIHTIIQPVANELGKIVNIYGRPSATGTGDDQEQDVLDYPQWVDLRARYFELRKHYDGLTQNMKRIEPVFSNLGPGEMQVVLQLDAFYGPTMMAILAEVVASGNMIVEGEASNPSRILRDRLASAYDFIYSQLTILERASH
ncbi:hypothetical protein IM543_07085 [Massilia sp. UMI-21]|nr:hypothetical protein IM543_07085 [Massilia sp. UMI-21]